MVKFNDLSVELISLIFSFLQSDKAQLHNLALSTRLFRDIAQRFIIRNASVSHSVNGSRTKLLLRTLAERPDLVKHVHRLELDLLREDIHWPEEQNTIYQITRRLTNLREFCYLSRDYKVWYVPPRFSLCISQSTAVQFAREERIGAKNRSLDLS